jgi:hypothetical protein
MHSAGPAIIAVIRAAATRSPQPLNPLALLDRNQTNTRHSTNLNSIIAYHLHHKHKLTDAVIANAYQVSRQVIYYRRLAAIRLIKKSPWRKILLSLP